MLSAASAVGYGLGLAGLILLLQHDGGLGYDVRSYWLAGRHVFEGEPLYWPVAIDALGPYRYPPLFAQLWAPFALLPELAFAWLWRLVCLLSLRVLAGCWRNVGLWMIVPLTITELSSANVTFPVAALAFHALRGRPGLAPWAAALKVGPAMLLPYLWLRRPHERRALLLGVAALTGACVVSLLLAPDYWVRYVELLGWQAKSAMVGDGLISLLPTAGADFALRAAVASLLVGIAARRGSDALAYAATVIAVPSLWLQRLVPLLAVPRLLDGMRGNVAPGHVSRDVGRECSGSDAGPMMRDRPATRGGGAEWPPRRPVAASTPGGAADRTPPAQSPARCERASSARGGL